MKEFWEEKHRNKLVTYLSGHCGATVIKGLYIEPIIGALLGSSCEVLEIGVGLGICTRDLRDMGMHISCVDISEEALRRVEKYCDRRFLSSKIDTLPTDFFDLAISFCVTQHIDDAALSAQLWEVIRSLKPEGIFAMQYAFAFYGSPLEQGRAQMEAGAVNRPIERMHQMVAEAGGRIVLSRVSSISPQFQSGWGVIHIMKGFRG